jgi:hypothetical protein
MTVLGVFLLFSILVGWLLLLVYRETEQDFPPVHRCQPSLITAGSSSRQTGQRGPHDAGV